MPEREKGKQRQPSFGAKCKGVTLEYNMFLEIKGEGIILLFQQRTSLPAKRQRGVENRAPECDSTGQGVEAQHRHLAHLWEGLTVMWKVPGTWEAPNVKAAP